jgi:hypothetical protein
VLQKRLDLIERTAQLAGKAPGIDDVWSAYLKEISASAKRSGLPTHDPSLSNKLGEYNGEFQSVLYLDALFFGSKTREAIAAFNLTTKPRPYWDISADDMNRLLGAMASELQVSPVSQSVEKAAK